MRRYAAVTDATLRAAAEAVSGGGLQGYSRGGGIERPTSSRVP
jgi:hypothetical protein